METRILIVDDDPWTPQVVGSALRDGDYTFSVARDGCVALAKALRDPPQLVISDVRMPGMSGWRLIRKLRAHRRLAATPFIFLTDMTSTAMRRHGFRVGADDYLEKPCDPRELALRVQRLLRRGRSRGGQGPAEARGFSAGRSRTSAWRRCWCCWRWSARRDAGAVPPGVAGALSAVFTGGAHRGGVS
jgi:DNA-binding response OmpR family regulator